MENKSLRKLSRKVKHCESILLKYENIKTTEFPTKSIFIGNGGLGCSIQRELLVDVFGNFGRLHNVLMLPGKPYAFVVYLNKEDAIKGIEAINGKKLPSGHVFYLSYIQDSDLPQESYTKNLWPPGLILLENFLNENEEKELLSLVEFELEENITLKHRRVRHYGYEFLYGKNSVDKNKKLDANIPDVCNSYLKKLVSLGYVSKLPDQLTVNNYLPGQGIPPHIDTHSAFEDGIISLSLGSQVVMDFYHPTKGTIPVLIPNRSMLIMTGESRYLWKHGITPRKTDIVPVHTEEGISLTLCHRAPRTSFTFRIVRRGECNCDYADQCDSKKSKAIPDDLVNEDEAKELERKYVNEVYETIADHFSDTRYKPWPKVASFLNSVPLGSLILDIGCGNGKNMQLSTNCFQIGCDASTNLAEVCFSKNIQVLVADCLKLPFRDGCADVVICIAVIHHLATKVRRVKAVSEIMRVLKTGGKALIYVWAFEQERPEGPSNYIKTSKLKQLKETDNRTVNSTEIKLNDSSSSPKTFNMPVHKNRTNFIQQDILVPWKEKQSFCQSTNVDLKDSVHHRYYHVFVEGELELLVTENRGVILSSYYDKGNWCVLFVK